MPSPGPSEAPGGGLALLLLVADGRLPAGGHAHSGGVEAAVAAGHLTGLVDLEDYLDGRLATTGRVDAAVAVATWRTLRVAGPDRLVGPAGPVVDAAGRAALTGRKDGLAGRAGPDGLDGLAGPDGLDGLDAEASARMASPAQRAASRAQGRGLLRVARRCWSAPVFDDLGSVHPGGPLAAMVLGAIGAVGAMTALEVATATLWSVVSAPGWAAVRLLGLDPLEVTAALARRAPEIDREAATAAAWGRGDRPSTELPAAGAPLSEIGAEAHASWEVRLFAS